MGKKYYCEYCDKSFKDDSNIRKKHIEGLPHQKARQEHYANFKSKKKKRLTNKEDVTTIIFTFRRSKRNFGS